MGMNNTETETQALAASVAAATKTPFWTTFKITIAMGLARLVLFTTAVGLVVGGILLYGLLK